MSTFEQLERSQEGSRPIEIYDFAIGAETFHYTSSEDELTVGGQLYTPERGIQRNSTVQGRDDKNRQLEIRLPSSNSFADKWKIRPPGLQGSVTIRRGQRDEAGGAFTTEALVFKGLVRAVQFPGDGKEAVMAVSSLEALQQRPVPRFAFTSQCNHFLYDTGCGVDPDLHKFTGVVSVEAGSTITVPGIGAFSAKFPSGFVVPQSFTDFRTIRSQSGDVLTLKVPFATSVLNQTLDCFKGCNHLALISPGNPGDCDTEFDNIIENGGFYGVPLRNPFRTGLALLLSAFLLAALSGTT